MSQSTKNTNKTNLEIADRTNQANIDIAQMSNDYNMAMLDKQIAEQWKMWNAQNEYNSPEAQKERLLAAGYNPYMQNVDAGSASSMSAPSAQPAVTPTMVGATMQSSDPLMKVLQTLEGMQTIAETVQGTIKGNQQIQRNALDNDTAKKSQSAILKLLNSNADVAEIGRNFEQRMKELDLAGRGFQNDLLFQQANIASQQFAQEVVKTNFIEPQMQQGLQVGAQSLRLMWLQGRLTDKQLDSMSLTIARQIVENDVFSRTADSTVSSADSAARSAAANADVDEQTVGARVQTARNNSGANSPVQAVQMLLKEFARFGIPGIVPEGAYNSGYRW